MTDQLVHFNHLCAAQELSYKATKSEEMGICLPGLRQFLENFYDESDIAVIYGLGLGIMAERARAAESTITTNPRWETGTLTTATICRVLMDALADLWQDCYRRGDVQHAPEATTRSFQRHEFREVLMDAIHFATGEAMRVM